MSPLGFPKGVTPLLDLPPVLSLPCPIQDVPTATLSTGGDVVSGAAYAAIEADMVDMETWALVRAGQTPRGGRAGGVFPPRVPG